MIYLINKPAGIIIIIDTNFKIIKINRLLLNINDKIQKNLFSFLNRFSPIDISNIDIQIININIVNKYYQMIYTIPYVQTYLVIFLNDYIFLLYLFLNFIVFVFENLYINLYKIKKIIYCKNLIIYSF
jgi:hypothetical protein